MQSSSFPFITPSSTCMSEDLLFFDTFSHSNSEKDNFDLVQFPSPVIIDLIKIVPLGQPIEANIPGNVRLGATNPSKCELEFFINDLNKQDAHTMTDLGKFHCSDKDTDFAPPLQIQTDGLLMRGSYRTLTLAIFGQIVAFDEKPEDDQAILSATSPPAQTPASPIASERDIPYIVRSMDHELIKQVRDEDNSLEESILKSNEYNQNDPTLASGDVVTEDAIMDHVNEDHHVKRDTIVDELSNSGEPMTPASINNVRDKKSEEIDYSNSSDMDNSVRRLDKSTELPNKHSTDNHVTNEAEKRQESDDCSVDYDAQEWYFNIETYTPKALTYFPNPSLTLQERTLQANMSMSDNRNYLENVEKEATKVKEMFEVLGCSDDEKTEDWVTLIEDLTNDIANMSLSHTVSSNDMLKFLVKQILYGLDMTSALSQKQTGFKVRHLKAGIKLATTLFHCGPLAVSNLLESGVMQRLLLLYNEEQMSLPLRLLIFKSLSAGCDTVEGVEHMIEHEYCFANGATLIDRVQKGQVDDSSAIRNIEEEYPAEGQKSLTCYQYMLLLLLSKPVTRIKIAIGNLIKKIRLYRDLSTLSTLARVKNDPTDTEDSVFERDQNDNLEDKERLEKCLQLVQDVVTLTKDGCVSIAQPVRYLPAKLQFHTKPSPTDSYLAVFKWIKHFRIIESLDFLLISTQTGLLDADQSIKLRGACLALIQQISGSPRGAQLLLSDACSDQSAALIRNLGQKVESTKKRSHLDLENLLDASLCREESISIATCRDMSLKLAYSFKVLSCIDKLFDFHRELISERSGESRFICDPEKVLHQLLIMSNHPYGLTAIMRHFSCIGNLDCILRFLDMPEYHKHLEFVRETLIDYVLELVGTFFRLNNNVLEIAEEYLDTLVDLCKIKDKTMSNRIKSLLPWLTPFDTDQPFPLITYSDETFRQLTRIIRKSIPDCSIPFAQGLDFHLPPQLITAVRILRQLCISPQVETFIESNFDIFSCQRLFLTAEACSPISLPFVDSLPRTQNPNHSWNLNFHHYSESNECPDDSLMDRVEQLSNLSKLYQPYDESICGDLKYHYGVMQVFEQEGLKRLLNTLRELTGNYPRPLYQSAALCGLRGRIVISYIHSVVMLLHSFTCHLIDARGKEFRDTSIISVVLETYSLLSFVPKPENNKFNELSKTEDLSALQKSITLKYDNYQMAQQAKKLILSILISYTQICLSVSESEENVISKSMWAKMLKEVIDFTLSAPVFFHHGLDVLTRILPAPLPSASILDTIDQEQLFKNINHRKLWSAHLHPLHQRLELMISNMSLCYHSSIRNLLHYLCSQLCDLSSNTACMVAKTVTDTLISSAAKLAIDSGSDSHSNDQSTSNNQAQSRFENEEKSTVSSHLVLNGTKESSFAIKMVLNLLGSLITNQAFETALTNHLQIISKKDEKLLMNLYTVIRLQDDAGKTSENASIDNVNSANSNTITVPNLIEAIRSATDCSQTKNNLTYSIPLTNVTPPEELTKINLIEMTRRTTDRFNLTTGITRTYRLKVLMDLNSRAHRSTEGSSSSKRFERSSSSNQELLVPPSHKSSYVAPSRGRQRPSMRPDSFRSRPQNTSRPPSIHVDDFNDMYGGEVAGQNSIPPRYGRKDDFRGSPVSRYQDLAHGRVNSPMSGPSHDRRQYLNSNALNQPPPSGSSAYGSRSHHSRSKYMKMK